MKRKQNSILKLVGIVFFIFIVNNSSNILFAQASGQLRSTSLNQPSTNFDSQLKEDKKWVLNQKNTDIREFIAQVARITGETFVIDPRIKPSNTVSIVSSSELTSDEVYDVFLEVLLSNGYTVVPKGSIMSITPAMIAKHQAINNKKRPNAGAIMTTRIIKLANVSALELVPVVKQLIAQFGYVSVSPSSNTLIVTDLVDNVEKIYKITQELDRVGNDDYEVIELKYASVSDVAKIIQDTMLPIRGNNSSGLQVISDEKSNRLIVKGNKSSKLKVNKLIKTIDREGITKSTTKVIFLRHSEAKHLSVILSEAAKAIQQNNQSSMQNTSNHFSGYMNPKMIQSPQGGKKTLAFVKADESQNALILIADPDVLSQMERIVKQLDIPRSQVLLEAAIVEVSGGVNDALGLQWGIDGQKTNVASKVKDKLTGHILTDATINLGSIALRNSNFGVLVTALSEKSNNNILSTPSIVTLDNKEAELKVGKNVPIKTGSYQTSSGGSSTNPFTTTERKDIGIKLKITPQINDANTIKLVLEQEISTLDNTVMVDGDIVFNSRVLKTTVLLNNSQTIVIGGLMEDFSGDNQSKVPLLGDIPLIGNLFRKTTKKVSKRNLMLFIRPTIMNNSSDLGQTSQDRYSKLKLLRRFSGNHSHMPNDLNAVFDGEAIDVRKINEKLGNKTIKQ